MELSAQGINLLVMREASRKDAYLDSKGIPTIGVGHTGPEVHLGLHWTTEQVEAAFRADLERFERAVNEGVTVPIEQFRYDALVSFSFNVGVTAFKTSTMLREINADHMEEAARQFDRWHIPPEITSRRNAEREQFKGAAFEARIA